MSTDQIQHQRRSCQFCLFACNSALQFHHSSLWVRHLAADIHTACVWVSWYYSSF